MGLFIKIVIVYEFYFFRLLDDVYFRIVFKEVVVRESEVGWLKLVVFLELGICSRGCFFEMMIYLSEIVLGVGLC